MTSSKSLIDEIREEIKGYFADFGAHDFQHTERVYNLAVNISEYEDSNKEIVALSALLHDIARQYEEEGKSLCHAEEGALIAEKILLEKGLDRDKIEAVKYNISVHRFSKGINPETIEAKIIQDADRLDSLGAIVIARTFAQDGIKGKPIYNPKVAPNKKYTGDSSTGINHLYEKILNIRPDDFYTERARNVAEKRYEFVRLYIETFEKEWIGKR